MFTYLKSLFSNDLLIELSESIISIKVFSSEIKYEDELENKVTISFNNSIYNKEIKKDVFRFIAPDYYDIIRK